jgi:hypothetical protein
MNSASGKKRLAAKMTEIRTGNPEVYIKGLLQQVCAGAIS